MKMYNFGICEGFIRVQILVSEIIITECFRPHWLPANGDIRNVIPNPDSLVFLVGHVMAS